jgi:hypothetical protein
MQLADSFHFNGLLPLKMPTLPCAGFVSALSGRKLPTSSLFVQPVFV